MDMSFLTVPVPLDAFAKLLLQTTSHLSHAGPMHPVSSNENPRGQGDELHGRLRTPALSQEHLRAFRTHADRV